MSIVDEFLLAMNGLDDWSRRWLSAQGVPPGIIEVSPGPITFASIETDSLGCFQFATTGKRAFLHPITVGGPFSDIVDLVAWFPDQPDRWWTRLYTGVPLGVDALDRAEIEGLPLLLHPTPLSWLCAGGEGVCVLDWVMTASTLRCVPTLVLEQAAFGQHVRDRLSLPPLAVPEIRVLTKDAA